MDSYEVLDVLRAEEWGSYLDQMTHKDIYFTPEYCRLYEENGEGKAQLFVYKHGGNLIIYAYLLRTITGCSVIRELDLQGEWYDIITPYGYGGPLSNLSEGGEKTELFRRFGDIFTEYCRESSILTEFVRFHPFIKNYQDYLSVAPQMIRNTVYMDLRGTEADLIRNYSKNHKADLRKIKTYPLTARTVRPENHLDHFMELYYNTLESNQANEYYYFSTDFFKANCRLLDHHLELFQVMCGDETASAVFIMHYGPYIHYHLMGWDRKYVHMIPNKLLIHSIALWGMEKGYEYLHLGGGFTGNDDSLFRFKKGFGGNNQLDFYIGKKVHLPEVYNKIAKQMMAEEAKKFFPVYRYTASL
ncbi:MAG: hypothetical protein JWM44_4458 [Bacilli bacterium]|nr:hypothetical protein [Bacilli bacterium]